MSSGYIAAVDHYLLKAQSTKSKPVRGHVTVDCVARTLKRAEFKSLIFLKQDILTAYLNEIWRKMTVSNIQAV